MNHAAEDLVGFAVMGSAYAKLVSQNRRPRVALLSFSSGLPLGLVWYSIPDWMRSIGVDIRIVGLFTLAQAPWAFKVLWSPLMDRYVPPFWGRRRGWMAVTQIALGVVGVIFHGQLAVGLLDLLICGFARHTQHLVVTFCHATGS